MTTAETPKPEEFEVFTAGDGERAIRLTPHMRVVLGMDEWEPKAGDRFKLFYPNGANVIGTINSITGGRAELQWVEPTPEALHRTEMWSIGALVAAENIEVI